MSGRGARGPHAGAMLAVSPRVERLLFVLTLIAFAWFHQGGGWGQNVRFALVRAMVEQETFAIDDYLVYRLRVADGTLARAPLRRGVFERDGARRALAWRTMQGESTAIDPEARGDAPLVAVETVAASGDLAYHDGHFHPNKAPGTSFLAVPGYAVVHAIELALGLDGDRFAVLTANAWLASVLSVGLVSALGVVLLLRLARQLASERDAVLTALVFAFGTMHWPHATLLFEHNVIAVGLLAAFYLIERARAAPAETDLALAPLGWLVLAGLAAGWAAITNYAMAPLVALLGCFAMVRAGWWRGGLGFGLGVLVPLALVCAYHWACFGTPFTTNYAYQNQMFVAESRLLGVFAVPRLDVLLTVLFSPYRGLFFTSPVLLVGVAGLVLLWRGGGPHAWTWMIGLVAAYLMLMNASFNGWDGGYTAVPRYLGPAVPFLSLPIALAWRRWRLVTATLAALAIAIQLLVTAVDPQVPIGDRSLAGHTPYSTWSADPLTRYLVPLFVGGRPWPMLEEGVELLLAGAERRAQARGVPPEERERARVQLEADLRAQIARGDPVRIPLAGVWGPVSANPIGIYEGGFFRLTPAGSRFARANSLNAGELIVPESRWSLLPLLLVAALLGASLARARPGGSDGSTEAAAGDRDRVRAR